MIAALILAIVALLTSIISGILGMGGGILLLAVLLSFLPAVEAITVHASVQIFSNGTRAIIFFKSCDRPALKTFLLGAVPGAVLGWFLLRYALNLGDAEPYLKVGIGLYVLAAALLPAGGGGEKGGGGLAGFFWIGCVAGLASLTVGAVGPLIAPVFRSKDFVKERLISTKAACQLSLHVLKVPALLALGTFDVPRFGAMTLLMIGMVIPGTLIGERLLRYVKDEHFRVAYRVALLTAGVKVLCVDGLWAIFTGVEDAAGD